MYRRLTLNVALLAMSVSCLADEISDAASESVKSNFAAAALLSDDRVVKLGFWDFDPNQIIGTRNDQLGSEEASARRDSIKQFSLPWQFAISGDKQSTHRWWASARLAFVETRQQLSLGTEENTVDDLDEQVFTVGSGINYRYRFDKHWDFTATTNVSWMRYRNRLTYGADSSAQYAPILDGVLTNYDVDMVMIEPVGRASYRWQGGKNEYKLFSSFHYLTGIPSNTDNRAHDVNPNAWYASAGLELKRPFSFFGYDGQQLWMRLSRIELSSDLSRQMGTGHYYEFSLAWLAEMTSHTSFLKDLGIGVNINYGSALRGGTLIFVYHFKD